MFLVTVTLTTHVAGARAAGASACQPLPCVSSATAQPPEAYDHGPIRCGKDGTRGKLSEALLAFFGNATGENRFLPPDIAKGQRQANGKYPLGYQLLVPLSGIANPRCMTPHGGYIYGAFIYENPLARTFLETTTSGEIVGAALADLKDIRKAGRIVGVVPRVTVYYRSLAPPKELENEAVATMRAYYSRDGSQFAPDSIVVVHRRLPTTGGRYR